MEQCYKQYLVAAEHIHAKEMEQVWCIETTCSLDLYNSLTNSLRQKGLVIPWDDLEARIILIFQITLINPKFFLYYSLASDIFRIKVVKLKNWIKALKLVCNDYKSSYDELQNNTAKKCSCNHRKQLKRFRFQDFS